MKGSKSGYIEAVGNIVEIVHECSWYFTIYSWKNGGCIKWVYFILFHSSIFPTAPDLPGGATPGTAGPGLQPSRDRCHFSAAASTGSHGRNAAESGKPWIPWGCGCHKQSTVVTAVGAKPIQTPRSPTPKLNIPKRLSYIYIYCTCHQRMNENTGYKQRFWL